MFAKKLAVLAAAAAVSAPALADRGNHYGHFHNGHRPVVERHYVVQHRPVVHQYVYRPAPRPVFVAYRPAPVYYQPAPVYYSEPVNGAALLVGAVLGAAIVHAAVTH